MNRSLLRTASAVITAVLSVSAAAAQHADDLVTDRPDQTESSRVVPATSVQVEVGALYESRKVASNVYDEHTGTTQLPGLLLRIGVGGWLELRGIAEWTREEITFAERPRPATTRPSFGPPPGEVSNDFTWGIGGKVQLLDEAGPVPETAFIGHLIFPEHGDLVHPEFRFCMSNTLSSIFGLGYNIGGEFDPNQELFTLVYTLSLGADVTDDFGGYIEIFGDWNRLTRGSQSLDAGLTWRVRDNLQLDVSGGVGLTAAAPDHFLGAGISIRFPR